MAALGWTILSILALFWLPPRVGPIRQGAVTLALWASLGFVVPLSYYLATKCWIVRAVGILLLASLYLAFRILCG